MSSFKTFLVEDTVLTKLKAIFSGSDVKSSNLPAVVKPTKSGVVDQSKRNMLKRSAASSVSNAIDMTPLNALVKLLKIDPTAKPYKLTRSRDAFDIDDIWSIDDDTIENCRGHEDILRKWCAMAKKAMASKSLKDIFDITDATERGEGFDLFGTETYNGWFVEFELDDTDFDQSILTPNDQELVDDNIFANRNWAKLSKKAQAELARVLLSKGESYSVVEYIWAKCDIVLTVLPLIKK